MIWSRTTQVGRSPSPSPSRARLSLRAWLVFVPVPLSTAPSTRPQAGTRHAAGDHGFKQGSNRKSVSVISALPVAVWAVWV